jgi:hypothetical protein
MTFPAKANSLGLIQWQCGVAPRRLDGIIMAGKHGRLP